MRKRTSAARARQLTPRTKARRPGGPPRDSLEWMLAIQGLDRTPRLLSRRSHQRTHAVRVPATIGSPRLPDRVIHGGGIAHLDGRERRGLVELDRVEHDARLGVAADAGAVHGLRVADVALEGVDLEALGDRRDARVT